MRSKQGPNMRNLCRAAAAVMKKAGADEEWHFFIAGISIDASCSPRRDWPVQLGPSSRGGL